MINTYQHSPISIYVRKVMYIYIYIYVEYKSTYTTYSAFVLQK